MKLKSTIAAGLLLMCVKTGYSQCAAPPVGCSNTDFTNSFRNSSNPNTLEYDNIVSTFHSTVARQADGSVLVWGEYMSNSGTAHVLTPQPLNSTNYPALTGTILRFTGGSKNGVDVVALQQFVVLTTTGLFAWGGPGAMLDGDLTSSSEFQKITVSGKPDGLPAGVSPAEVKMLFGTHNQLGLVTCSGDVYTLVNTGETTVLQDHYAYGDGAARSEANDLGWHRVMQSPSVPLGNVVALRGGGRYGFMALKSDGTIWTWGASTYLGNGTIASPRQYATQMSLPAGITPKMIGMKGSTAFNQVSYYILSTAGTVHSLGSNAQNQLGEFTGLTESTSWINAMAGPVTPMSNIVWISPSEHDGEYMASVNALTANGSLYAWGTNNHAMIGMNPAISSSPPVLNPGGLTSPDLLAVETGGHTSIVVNQCTGRFGYVGHRVNGSMGDGSTTNEEEPAFNFSETAHLDLCGAPAVARFTTASNSMIAIGVPFSLNVNLWGGTFSVIQGSATVSSSGVVTATGPGPIRVVYTLTSPCNTQDEIVLTTGISISGNVYHDPNGLTDITVFGIGTNVVNTVNAVLYDNGTGRVVTTTPVAANGFYEFQGVTPGNDYSVFVTTQSLSANQLISGLPVNNGSSAGFTHPSLTPPANWEYTGEYEGSGICGCGNPDGFLVLGTVNSTVTDANFGLNELPTPGDATLASQPNPGGANSVIVPASAFSGTDSDGTVEYIYFTQFPSNATSFTVGDITFYPVATAIPATCPTLACLAFTPDGHTIAAPGGVPSQTIRVDPIDGSVTVDIPYKVYDNGEGESLTTGSVKVPFMLPTTTITGYVFHDNDGNSDGQVDGAPLNTVDGLPLYTVLVRSSDNVVISSSPVASNGLYTLTGEQGVNYTVILTTNNPSPGDISGTNFFQGSLPSDWVYTGEQWPIPGFPPLPGDGVYGLYSNVSNDVGYNFGLERKPVVEPIEITIAQPSANAIPTGVITTAVLGNDPDGGAGNTAQVLGNGDTYTISDPTNGTMSYSGTVVPAGGLEVINFNPANVSFTGLANGSTSTSFSYSYTDAAGESAISIYTIKWDSPLPVKLISLTVSATEKSQASITWKTVEELNSKGFEIQHSVEGNRWTSLGFVPSRASVSTSETAYSYVHQTPQNGLNLYRLKMIDLDGTSENSRIVSLSLSLSENEVVVYPNPVVQGKMALRNVNLSEIRMVEIADMSGRLRPVTLTGGNEMDVSQLSDGLYILRLTQKDGQVNTRKFLVNKAAR